MIPSLRIEASSSSSSSAAPTVAGRPRRRKQAAGCRRSSRISSAPPPDGAHPGDAGHGAPVDTLPLGLPESVWRDIVLGGRPAPHGLLSSILQSRNAALLYYGVLSLDDETRSWLAGQPELVEVATRYVGSFIAAAPSLRVCGGTMRVPGGAPAEGAWEALAGARVSQPAAFVRALLTRDEGRLAFFFGALAPLTERQVAFALRLDAPHTEDRIEAAQRLHLVFARLVLGSDLENRTFWRPAVDPALLASDLRLDASGAPVLPGTQEFWKLVFAATAPRESAVDRGDSRRANRCSSGGCAIRCSAPMPISRFGGTAPCCLRRAWVSR